ncbi:hypothetical protein N657DRAFT_625238 [Parathielavia appendiculata]|uniref:F-box domain-containing protein n=1 Tax=Parathielavia appendiculata TaxID=2587402 RepID=A0AAN6TTB0_9PEZI|nr:hypothetical protein N657DRAFT_625238 [Parathielavia appendiculata]
MTPTKATVVQDSERASNIPPVQDVTQPLELRSKRTERRRRKLEKRALSKPSPNSQLRGFMDLPIELLLQILEILRPSDIFVLGRVNKTLHAFLMDQETRIARNIINLRYPILERCLLRPVLMEAIDSAIQPLLKQPDRPDLLLSHRVVAHQNIPPPDNSLHCTCLTCLMRWNALCAVVDLAHWQDNLDKGEPIPTIPRGMDASWNRELLARHRRVVINALTSPLWYARLLEAHLDSTARSIRRHGLNKTDQRPHFHITDEDQRVGTDSFLQRKGPPTVEYPYARDFYYMLEAFLPCRNWVEARQQWVYVSQAQEWHEIDLRMLVDMDAMKRQQSAPPIQVSNPSLPRCDNRCLIARMGDLYRHYGTRSLWEKYEVLKCPVVEVTEVWVEDESHGRQPSALVETKTVSSSDVDNWLEEPPRHHFPAGAYTRSARLVWVGQDGDQRRLSPSTMILESLADAWKLQDALSYTRGCFAGVSALAADGDAQVFTVAYHPKLAMAWSHRGGSSESGPQTHTIIFAEGEERAELRRILRSEWSAATAKHSMFPALLCSLMLAHSLDTTLADIKAAVREVEARTGHHRFASRRQTQPAAGELGHLSAQMSGCAAKLANGTRKMKVVEAINEFIAQHTLQPPHLSTNPGEPFSKTHIDLLRHRVQMQAVDTAYVQQRVQIQIAALFHLIAQQDNAIAFDTASATRSIAASSLQDSSSMKMLALVAMFFLPGSFVAALFSAPLFAWDEALASGEIAVATRPQFALFWAVTAPLTAVVFVLYGVWMCIQGRRERGQRRSASQLDIV